jgi:cyclin H
MLACVFLSAKIENLHISITDFVKNIKNTVQELVLELEFVVSRAIRFQFNIHTPLLPTYGFYLNSQKHLKPEEAFKLYEQVISDMNSIILTDAILLYAPSQIALAAFHRAAKTLGLDIHKFISEIAPNFSTFVYKLDNIANGFKLLPKDEIKELDRKLSECRELYNKK